MEIESRVKNYWTKRAHDFSTVRRNELDNKISDRWLEEFYKYFPNKKSLRILDVGTGSGYFSILLSKQGHSVTGIDLTTAMLKEAINTSKDFNVLPEFLEMDAQNIDFSDETFDAVISRNLTWTLPDPKTAYKEWHRVLKKGGILLNFDANYADNVRHHKQSESYISSTDVYGHCGVTPELEKESDEITLSMPCSLHRRPDWDINTLNEIGFITTKADLELGKRVLREHDLSDAPLFLIYAQK